MAPPLPWNVFLVDAKSATSTDFYLSAPDSGYSVDNLPPSVPQNLQGAYTGNGVAMRWSPSEPENDVRCYAVHRSLTEHFVPTKGTLIGWTASPAFTDSLVLRGLTYFYRIMAADFTGNVSAPSDPVLIVPVSNPPLEEEPGTAPSAFSLKAPYPNPAHARTTTRLLVPEPVQITVRVLHADGTTVRTLVRGTNPAGIYRVSWNGFDDRGRPAASGLYFLRCEATGEGGGRYAGTQRVVWVR